MVKSIQRIYYRIKFRFGHALEFDSAADFERFQKNTNRNL